jgi:transcription elongation factor Elf1
MNDLIDILKEKLTPAEIVELLKEYYPTQYELDNYAIENFVCPICYNRLISKNLYEPMEYFGMQVTEEIIKLECENCGFVVD